MLDLGMQNLGWTLILLLLLLYIFAVLGKTFLGESEALKMDLAEKG